MPSNDLVAQARIRRIQTQLHAVIQGIGVAYRQAVGFAPSIFLAPEPAVVRGRVVDVALRVIDEEMLLCPQAKRGAVGLRLGLQASAAQARDHGE